MINNIKTQNDRHTITDGVLFAQLHDFRQDNTRQQTEINEHQWTYYALGNPDNEALLLLSGGGGDAESMFQYIQHFSEQFRVIAPNIPTTLTTLADVMIGLRAVLAHEQINQAVVVGISFGAMLAQLYIRRFQDTVTDLVITHSMIPSQHLAEAMVMQKNILRLYPQPLLLWMSKRAYHNHIADSTTPADDTVKQFWQTYFSDLYSTRIRKKHLFSRARLTAEYHTENEFNSRDLLHWHGNMLIIESEQDNVINDGDRGSLKAMYSRAYVQTLDGYDHLAPILASPELISSISNFLNKED